MEQTFIILLLLFWNKDSVMQCFRHFIELPTNYNASTSTASSSILNSLFVPVTAVFVLSHGEKNESLRFHAN